MTISAKHKETFHSLVTAANDGTLSLMECKDSVTGEIISALCLTYEHDDGSYSVVPIGQLFNFDASQRIQLPAPEDGQFLDLPIKNLN
jgi:hypothetical protein